MFPPFTMSKFWKEYASLIGSLVQNSSWKVGQGNMSFWHENWSNMGVLADVFAEVEPPAPISLKEATEVNFSIPGISDAMIAQMRIWYDSRLKSDSDERLWAPSLDGRFTVKSAFSLISNQAPACPFVRHYWAKFLPKKMPVLLWRFLHNAIPVDVRIQDCAISLASRCLCCVHRNIESVDHLFLSGEIEAFLWDRLSPLFGIHQTNYRDLQEFITAWFNVAYRKSQMGKLATLFPMAIMWEIWSERNRQRQDESPSSMAAILYKVLQWVHNINHLLRISNHSPGMLHHILRVCKLSPTPEAAGGGVIRNDQGILLAAFHSFYGSDSNNLAETRALLDGLLLCQQLGITNFIVKVDSNLVAGWYNQKCSIPWHLSFWWQRIREATENLNINLKHIYRELNSSADCMASLGLSSRSNCSITADFLMRLVGLACLDRLGMPYIRLG
ncbi:Reverse transcriptase zinc-binding domain [Macleaya cordata]|uniref:Reverse transcriptase zinc-binding domain n=1 Tax=Macleaya cordata TaxID=56857 RepID=A0A200QH90_MACCD|nr:Reverse transcriptase zinc-binding domain [Macleaya cordata]